MDEAALRAVGLANGRADGIKILGDGELTKKLTVSAHAFSASAKAKIEAKGGACEIVGRKPAAGKARRAGKSLTPAYDYMFRSIFNTFANCFKIPELKSRILFTLVVLAVCRLTALHRHSGPERQRRWQITFNAKCHRAAADCWACTTCSPAARYETLRHRRAGHHALHQRDHHHPIAHGGHVRRLSKLAREEGGRAKIIQYGRYLTVLLCLGQGLYFAIGWEHPANHFPRVSRPAGADQTITSGGISSRPSLIMTTGTMLLMWLGEQITDRGIGNGVSLVITIGILARLPQAGAGSDGHVLSAPAAWSPIHHLMGTRHCCWFCCWRW